MSSYIDELKKLEWENWDEGFENHNDPQECPEHVVDYYEARDFIDANYSWAELEEDFVAAMKEGEEDGEEEGDEGDEEGSDSDGDSDGEGGAEE